MSLKSQLILIITSAVLFIAVVLLGYQLFQQNKVIMTMQSEMIAQKEISDGIVRSQSYLASKEEVEKMGQKNDANLNAIKADLALVGAKLSAITVSSSWSKSQNSSNVPSTSTEPRGTSSSQVDDKYGYFNNKQVLSLNEKFANVEVPIGKVSFSAWEKDPWGVQIDERTYKSINVLGVDENGRYYTYSKFSIQSGGKEYVVPVQKSETVQEKPSARFHWWNPRLHLGLSAGLNVSKKGLNADAAPSVSLGIMSYGSNKSQPDLSVLQVGLGYGIKSENLQLHVSPLQYNIGRHTPITKNLYIGPTVNVNKDGEFTVGAGISAGL